MGCDGRGRVGGVYYSRMAGVGWLGWGGVRSNWWCGSRCIRMRLIGLGRSKLGVGSVVAMGVWLLCTSHLEAKPLSGRKNVDVRQHIVCMVGERARRRAGKTRRKDAPDAVDAAAVVVDRHQGLTAEKSACSAATNCGGVRCWRRGREQRAAVLCPHALQVHCEG